jgi:prepilin-type processing-associated H-X9-DG protein
VAINGVTGSNDASPQALILSFVEQSNKYAQFNFNYKTWNDAPAVAGLPAMPKVNLPARTQDVPIYLCPSDPSQTRRGSNDADTTEGTQGRLNYLACLGTTSQFGTTGPGAGIFTNSTVVPGQELQGVALGQIQDGTSNTALFAEVMRSTHPWPAVSGVRDNTVIILEVGNLLTLYPNSDSDGRSVPSCATGANWNSSIKYVGLQFERDLWGTTFYTHTLPPNWNRKVPGGNQQYNCGDTTISHFHVAASSYHSGGVNLGMADGSVRFVRDAINFTAWQAMGTMNGGEVINDS